MRIRTASTVRVQSCAQMSHRLHNVGCTQCQVETEVHMGVATHVQQGALAQLACLEGHSGGHARVKRHVCAAGGRWGL